MILARFGRTFIHTVTTQQMGAIMSGAVLDNTEPDLEVVQLQNSKLLWSNELDGATITTTNDQSNVINLYDNMTTQKWNAGTGTVDLDIVLDSKTLDGVGIAAGNWQTAGTTIEVWNTEPATDVKLGEVNGLSNGAPHLFIFDKAIYTNIRIRFISTGDLNVGQVGLGEVLTFPCLPTLGMELGKFNNADAETSSVTEGNAFGSTTLNQRSRNNVYPFQGISFDWVRNNWTNFSDTHKGKLVWFLWDYENASEDTVFGHWSTTSPVSYSRATYTDITLRILGHVR